MNSYTQFYFHLQTLLRMINRPHVLYLLSTFRICKINRVSEFCKLKMSGSKIIYYETQRHSSLGSQDLPMHYPTICYFNTTNLSNICILLF